MNRWTRPAAPGTSPNSLSLVGRKAMTLANRWAVLCIGASLLGASVQAQVNFKASQFAGQPNGTPRSFPAQARRGAMEVIDVHQVKMNGALVRLSPGSRIHSITNALVTSGSLVGQTVLVNYTLDVMGQPHEIWVLTEREAAEKRPGAEGVTTTNIVTEVPR
ncbi:MAG TPA: hypothetical protein VFY35_16315 [Burkholderiaceae bacterium]|nr:hypothetical protein [Burkholderiaceae bacterium]